MRYLSTITTLFLLLYMTPPAHAHALLDHASPRVGSSVASAPTELLLWFTQKVEPAFSRVEVIDSNGARVDEGSAQADPTDASLLRIALKQLPSGRYEVHWRVLSVDTHTAEGRFLFNVRN